VPKRVYRWAAEFALKTLDSAINEEAGVPKQRHVHVFFRGAKVLAYHGFDGVTTHIIQYPLGRPPNEGCMFSGFEIAAIRLPNKNVEWFTTPKQRATNKCCPVNKCSSLACVTPEKLHDCLFLDNRHYSENGFRLW